MAAPMPENHQILLVNRERLTVTGVRNVGSFDEQNVILETTHGLLQIKGGGLHVNQLSVDQEKMELEGRIDAVSYSEDRDGLKAKGLLARFFK